MSRFTWTQLQRFEEAALRRQVPQNIPGLIPKELASNYQWFRRGSSYERNGERNVFNHISVIRIGFFSYVAFFLYQQWRILSFGWTEMQEHHAYNYDNIVYDKLSTRSLPYHSPASWP